MARNPTGKPPKPSPKAKPKKTAGKAKYIEVTSKPSPSSNGKQKSKEKPLVLRRNSTSSTDSRQSSASNYAGKTVHGFGPVLGRDTSTPRHRIEEELFIEAVADATRKSMRKNARKSAKSAKLFVQEAETAEEIHADIVSDTDDSKDYPAVCRRCYINFSTQTSPVCCHRFCDECYAKSQTTVTYQEGFDEEPKFSCFACAKSQSESGSRASFHRQPPILEHYPKEIEKVYAFGSYAFINPQKCAVSSNGQIIIVVDTGCGKILLLNTNGELHQFSYLKNYRFQGGLCLTGDDTILLSLQNEKYTSTSFYSISGSFKFSAFLDPGAQVPHIVANAESEIVALDSVSNTLDIINEQKRVHKQKYLAESEVFNPTALATHPCTNYLYIFDGNNQCVSVFDNKYHFLFKFNLTKPEETGDASVGSGEKTFKLLIDQDGVLFRVTRTRVVAYSLDGQYIYNAVAFESNPSFQPAGVPPMKPVIRDACLAGQGKFAVLMVGGAHTGEIRIYEYQVPSKYKAKTRPRLRSFSKSNSGVRRMNSQKSCCVIA